MQHKIYGPGPKHAAPGEGAEIINNLWASMDNPLISMDIPWISMDVNEYL